MRKVLVTVDGSHEAAEDLRCTAGGGTSTVIYAGRNTVRRISHNGADLVVKEFGKSMKNEILYAVRTSKAKRSFDNARELLRRGVHTPAPKAYTETRGSFNRLLESSYVCVYEESVSLAEAMDAYGDSCVEGFAEFVAGLHDKGILHHDMNNTNVRVTAGTDGKLEFGLIDLNRMTFYPDGHKVALNRRFSNVCRFCSLDRRFELFARHYIECSGLAPENYGKMIEAKLRDNRRVDRKKGIKRIFKSKSSR